MAERTPLQQAQFDAAEMVNQANSALPPAENVVLEVKSLKVGSKATVKATKKENE